MKRIAVLGAGMVGSAIAADLSTEYEVRSVDFDQARLDALSKHCDLAVVQADLRDPARVQAAVADCELVIGAVPGHMGFATLKAVIEAGRNAVDISFFDEDPFELDGLARERGVTAVVDAGVAPGFSNMVLGHHAAAMSVRSFRCLVGGLPVVRRWPYQYKAPFSPIDVLEEYTRPARLVENGRLVVRPALSDAELVDVDPVGTLEAFNTDGLRTLLRTMKVPDMVEKTLRYPGHVEIMRVLRDSGFLSKETIDVRGVLVRPVDLSAALLFSEWRLEPGEAEFTAMHISVRGEENGEDVEYAYRLFDCYDPVTETSSMARTTGYTCTAVARLVLNEQFREQGVCAPEQVAARGGCFEYVVQELAKRRVTLECSRVTTP